jgi:hypothetical protein
MTSSVAPVPLHVLEKLWAISRILLFTSRTPKHVFSLVLINRAFRECLLQYKLAATIFDRLFDARNKWQSGDDVKQVWLQAVALLLKQESAPQKPRNQKLCFDTGLVSDLLAAMKHENTSRALAEFDRTGYVQREAAWKRSPHHVSILDAAYPQQRARFIEENPLPAFAAAPHRLAQLRGTLAAAFRGSNRNIDWFGVADEKQNKVAQLKGKTSILVSPSAEPWTDDDGFGGDFCFVPLGWEYRPSSAADDTDETRQLGPFATSFCYCSQPPLKLDVSLLPSTLCDSPLRGLRLCNTDLSASDMTDFLSRLAAASPRLQTLDLQNSKVSFEFSLGALASFPDLVFFDAAATDIWCSDGINFDDASPKLEHLHLSECAKLRGVIRGTQPTSLTTLRLQHTGLSFPTKRK